MAIPKDTIAVTVRAFATLREVMDKEVRLDLPAGAQLRLLLAELTGRYQGLNDRLFADPETLRDYVNILKNGRNIYFLNGLDTRLDDGDLIALFPPAAGG